MAKSLLKISLDGCGKLVKMLEPDDIVGPNFTHFFKKQVYYCPATGVQNGDEALPSSISAGRGLLVYSFVFHATPNRDGQACRLHCLSSYTCL